MKRAIFLAVSILLLSVTYRTEAGDTSENWAMVESVLVYPTARWSTRAGEATVTFNKNQLVVNFSVPGFKGLLFTGTLFDDGRIVADTVLNDHDVTPTKIHGRYYKWTEKSIENGKKITVTRETISFSERWLLLGLTRQTSKPLR